MSTVFITTSAYGSNEVLEKGQAYYFPIISKAGGKGVEIRGELYSEKDNSLLELGKLIKQNDLECIYSVTASIWKEDGELNEELIRLAITGAIELKAKIVKFCLGVYNLLKSDIDSLKKLLSELEIEKYNLQVTVENDQTSYGGNIKSLQKFLDDCFESGISIGMTFDIGNWNWSGENANEAAEALGKYVVYVHCKHAERNSNQWVTLPVPNDENAQWRNLISVLPQDIPRAIEFPIYSENLQEETKKYVQRLANA